MIELKKMHALIVKNLHNLDACQIIEIFLVLHSTHVVPKDQDKIVFYINNYIDWDQFNQLYDPDWMEKDIQNVNVVARKLEPALIKVTNYRLEVVREKQRKREGIVERRKTETMAARCQRARRRISLSSEEEKNYENDTGDKTDLNQAGNDKNLLQF